MKNMDNKAQTSNLLLLMIVFFLMIFVFGNESVQRAMISFGNSVFLPLIGFNYNYPILTIVIAGIMVVFLSSFFTNLFTDWKKMGESQEMSRAFQKEIQKARKEGNQNRVNKLMKMQPEIFKKQQEASGGMMKPMVFLIIFIWPIFIWLRSFLMASPHKYFSTPWADTVYIFSYPFNFGQAWIWLYFIFSFVIGQMIRQGLKYLTWTEWWEKTKSKILPKALLNRGK